MPVFETTEIGLWPFCAGDGPIYIYYYKRQLVVVVIITSLPLL